MAMREQLLPVTELGEGDDGNEEKTNENERSRADDLKFDLYSHRKRVKGRLLHGLRSDEPAAFSMRSEFSEQMNRQLKWAVCSILHNRGNWKIKFLSLDFQFKWIIDTRTRKVIAVRRSRAIFMYCALSSTG